jgi:hypothetical protein
MLWRGESGFTGLKMFSKNWFKRLRRIVAMLANTSSTSSNDILELHLSQERKDEMSDESDRTVRIPRFSYQVPDEVAKDFLEELDDTALGSAGELISVILRKYFRSKKADRMLRRIAEHEDQSAQVPAYGPTPPTPKAAQDKRKIGDEV